MKLSKKEYLLGYLVYMAAIFAFDLMDGTTPLRALRTALISTLLYMLLMRFFFKERVEDEKP